MRGIFDKIARVLGWVDAIEFAIPAILATFLLVVGPLLGAFYFLRTHHLLAAAGSLSLWALAAVTCVRDWRRRHVGWVSVALGVVWFVTTLILWWTIETV